MLRIGLGRTAPWESAENDLAKAVRGGDRMAFEQLTSRHSESVRRFLHRRVPQTDAEDVYQETMLAAWEHFSKFSGTGRFRTWLFAVCVNKIKDYWRRQQRLSPEFSMDVSEAALYLQPEFAEIDLKETLREAWGGLTPSQQELLELYYGAELTLQEISRVLGRNLSTVKYQFYRAHELAAERITPDFVERAKGSGRSK